MKGVKIIAYVQIVLSIVFVCTALKVQRSPVKMLDGVADACRNISEVIRKHNTEVYQPSMQKVFAMQEPLRDTGGKVKVLATVMQTAGTALQKHKGAQWRGIQLYPESLAALGASLLTTGESIGRSGDLMTAQSEIIGHYRENVYEQTVRTLESTSEQLERKASELRLFETPHSPLAFSIVILGAIFLLNGIALLVIAKASGTH